MPATRCSSQSSNVGAHAGAKPSWRAVVMTLGGGELARAEVFPERAQALEAAGLPD